MEQPWDMGMARGHHGGPGRYMGLGMARGHCGGHERYMGLGMARRHCGGPRETTWSCAWLGTRWWPQGLYGVGHGRGTAQWPWGRTQTVNAAMAAQEATGLGTAEGPQGGPVVTSRPWAGVRRNGAHGPEPGGREQPLQPEPPLLR